MCLHGYLIFYVICKCFLLFFKFFTMQILGFLDDTCKSEIKIVNILGKKFSSFLDNFTGHKRKYEAWIRNLQGRYPQICSILLGIHGLRPLNLWLSVGQTWIRLSSPSWKRQMQSFLFTSLTFIHRQLLSLYNFHHWITFITR